MIDQPARQELRPYLRDERAPEDSVVVVRGGKTTLPKLTDHVHRTHDAFVLDGQPLWGVSVFCALDDIGPFSLEGLLRRFASYRFVHLPRTGQLREFTIRAACVVWPSALHREGYE